MRNPFDPLDPRNRAISMLEDREWRLQLDQFRDALEPGGAEELQGVRDIKLDLILERKPSPWHLDKLSRDFRSELTSVYPDIDPFGPPFGLGSPGPEW
jgi:hypothetical protein